MPCARARATTRFGSIAYSAVKWGKIISERSWFERKEGVTKKLMTKLWYSQPSDAPGTPTPPVTDGPDDFIAAVTHATALNH
jgi:hypothetical protein